jgi:hypothetical protein
MCVGCNRPEPDIVSASDGTEIAPRLKGTIEVESTGEVKLVAGQTVYVPVYPKIPIGEKAQPLELAVTLCVRNTDRSRPITVNAVRYYDRTGKPLREFVQKPLRIDPMAANEFFIRERDTRGGTAASFLVDWTAEQGVTEPVIEAVMIGTAGNLGVSFTATGRVVGERAAPAAPTPAGAKPHATPVPD